MCTVIAKESQSRVIVLTGIPCCTDVDVVGKQIPKVTRENGWFELYVGEVCREVPEWAYWLGADAQAKVMSHIPETCRGKRVWFYDVSDRWKSS